MKAMVTEDRLHSLTPTPSVCFRSVFFWAKSKCLLCKHHRYLPPEARAETNESIHALIPDE